MALVTALNLRKFPISIKARARLTSCLRLASMPPTLSREEGTTISRTAFPSTRICSMFSCVQRCRPAMVNPVILGPSRLQECFTSFCRFSPTIAPVLQPCSIFHVT
ncbi:hypothetical protein RvY_17575-2 [Ramazzottius varieornatus]|uniref:Uncharacterized protein n=1 Tax=Ramazzottius varieornatus TaxID=947166 RepID=A0A1D1W4Q8_RAMVA|nr:hypothetical protein RvY_17575-2 [Ramazzottius varieornatus]